MHVVSNQEENRRKIGGKSEEIFNAIFAGYLTRGALQDNLMKCKLRIKINLLYKFLTSFKLGIVLD